MYSELIENKKEGKHGLNGDSFPFFTSVRPPFNVQNSRKLLDRGYS